MKCNLLFLMCSYVCLGKHLMPTNFDKFLIAFFSFQRYWSGHMWFKKKKSL